MTISDRAQKRIRLVLSVVVVCAVLATFSDVRKVIGRAISVVCGRDHSRMVAPDLRNSSARPSMISHDGTIKVFSGTGVFYLSPVEVAERYTAEWLV